MREEYYSKAAQNLKNKKILICFIFLLLYIPFIYLLFLRPDHSYQRTLHLVVIGIVVIFTLIMIAIVKLFLKIARRAIVIIDEKAIIINNHCCLSKTKVFSWSELAGYIVEEKRPLFRFFRSKKDNRILSLIFNNKDSAQVSINMHLLAQADEFIEAINQKIPDLIEEKMTELLKLSKKRREIRYNKYRLNERGIIFKQRSIPWQDVKKIKLKGICLAAYANIKIIYHDFREKKRSLSLKAQNKEIYSDFVKYLVKNSTQATIDPKIFDMLKAKPKEAKAEVSIILINVLTFFILMSGSYFIENYLFTWWGSTTIEAIMKIYFIMVIFRHSYKLSNGYWLYYKNIFKQLYLILGGSIVLVLSLVILFIVSPGAVDCLKGDINLNNENLEEAQYYYEQVLSLYPENEDILYIQAKVLYQLDDYREAFKSIEKAYNNSKSRWSPAAIKLIFDILSDLKEDEVVLEWYNRVLEDYSTYDNNKRVLKVLEQVRDNFDF
ncbi:tetratricopeptide repeat protein [Orenia marismortui]|uniref:Uncharacterized protein n=1 Tax=Orenia marismortui TaxID=46469 RepID=A0A4R8H3D8_9FIRM|nr:tetratricopeptide repeat protein [Orenia marismortui]TDX53260.1 hypothetical protein C7959_103112 [Orenia marismortui]